jgi:L-aspartate oxidase
MPVRPAAHYAMGGVATDLDGATDLQRLYAAGEVAATGVHGANRLASNSLLEGLVYGARAARAMVAQKSNLHSPAQPDAPQPSPAPPSAATPASASGPGPAELDKFISKVRSIMWDKVGIIRGGKELSEAVKHLEALSLPHAAPSRLYFEAQNMVEVARIIARSALAREESRGAHYRTDFPLKSETVPPQHSFVSKSTPVLFEQDLPRRPGNLPPGTSNR